MLRARANGETFVSATMCPQQFVLVCQGLYSQSAFYPWSAVCSLQSAFLFTPSLHFIPGLQSAVCSLRLILQSICISPSVCILPLVCRGRQIPHSQLYILLGYSLIFGFKFFVLSPYAGLETWSLGEPDPAIIRVEGKCSEINCIFENLNAGVKILAFISSNYHQVNTKFANKNIRFNFISV